MPVKKLDLKKEMRELWNPPKMPVLVRVPPLNFLMIDGKGDPNTAPEYRDAIQALYTVAYTVKFTLKKSKRAIDYIVPPLEGLWWMEDMALFSGENKDDWLWTAMIMQPPAVTTALVEKAVREAGRKKELPALARLRLECFDEGLAAQIMYTGPFADEKPTIEKLHGFIAEQGYRRSGKHHEIYLSDFRRTAPDKLRTIIRQPMTR
ncbi:MAG: GyrI-like domain-containing protein [Rudaea sp.]